MVATKIDMSKLYVRSKHVWEFQKSFRCDEHVRNLISNKYSEFLRDYYLKKIDIINKKFNMGTNYEKIGLYFFAAIALDVAEDFGLTHKEALDRLPKDLKLNIKKLEKCLSEYRDFKEKSLLKRHRCTYTVYQQGK